MQHHHVCATQDSLSVRRNTLGRTAVGLGSVLAPWLAQAHSASTLALAHTHSALSHVATGFSHPFTGLDHLAALLAIGVWSAANHRAWVPCLFMVCLVVAGASTPWTMQSQALELGIAASLLVMGLLLSETYTRTRTRTQAGGTGGHKAVMLSAVLVASFAVCHGAAHGNELTGTASLIGVAFGSAALLVAGWVAGLKLQTHAKWVQRSLGGALALFGLTHALAAVFA
ncbi:MAG: urease accessory protein [Burkholderiaceae bacterium]|jgi:urease accessory protein